MASVRKAFSAPMAKLIADGNKVFAWATGVTVQETIQNVPVDVLGTLYTQELAPTGIKVSVSVDTILIKDESLIKSGLYVQGDTVTVVQFPELTIELYDQIDDKPRVRVYGCKSAARSIPLGRGGIAATSVRFDAIRLEQLN